MSDFIPDQINQCRTILVSEIDRLPGATCRFLFSPFKPGYQDTDSIRNQFDEEWESLESHPDGEARQALVEILLPPVPYDLKIIEKLSYVNFPVIQDRCIALFLKEISHIGHSKVTPQLFIELMNFFIQQAPEFFVLADSLLHIIQQQGDLSVRQEVKTRACAVLINHYEIETLIIYISCHPGLKERGKQTLF